MPPSDPDRPSDGEPSITVLLVDDHDMVVNSLRRGLDREVGIEVIGVSSTVNEAVWAATRLRPDVIVMDYRLPDGTGVLAARRIRAEIGDARILLLTGSDEPGALAAAVDAGCVGFLEKGSPFERLVSGIRRAHAGELVLSPDDFERLRHGGDPTRPDQLTARELEILRLIETGQRNAAIAELLIISPHTVRTHVQNILVKLGAHSKIEAVAIARQRRLLS